MWKYERRNKSLNSNSSNRSNLYMLSTIIQPLRRNWKIDEDSGESVADQIIERCRSEDWNHHCKGFSIIQEKDITGRLGQPLKALSK